MRLPLLPAVLPAFVLVGVLVLSGAPAIAVLRLQGWKTSGRGTLASWTLRHCSWLATQPQPREVASGVCRRNSRYQRPRLFDNHPIAIHHGCHVIVVTCLFGAVSFDMH